MVDVGVAGPEAHDHRFVVAIDGPAASGKSTVARELSSQLGATYLDTGVIYRALTLAALQQGVPIDDGVALARLATNVRIRIDPAGRVTLDGVDVTDQLRTPEVTASVSTVSAHPEVRAALMQVQRDVASGGRVVMVGRDIATVVVPDAGVSIYLDATPEERARRRALEMDAAGMTAPYDQVLADVIRRDQADSTREAGPLRVGDRAVVILTDGMSVDQVVEAVSTVVQRAWTKLEGAGE